MTTELSTERSDLLVDEQKTTQVEETEELIDGDYEPPMLTITKTTVLGDVTDSIRVELHESDTLDSPGAVVHLLEVALRTLQYEPDSHAGKKTSQVVVNVRDLPADVATRMAAAMRRYAYRPAPPQAQCQGVLGFVPVTAEQLDEAVEQLSEHDPDCDVDHSEWIDQLGQMAHAAWAQRAADSVQNAPAGGVEDLADTAQAQTDGGVS